MPRIIGPISMGGILAAINKHNADNKAHANPWIVWTPTVTAETGSITSYTTDGEYMLFGGMCHFRISISITNAGTGAGTLRFTPPLNMDVGITGNISIGQGIDGAATGHMLNLFLSSQTAVGVRKYDFTTPIVTGHRLDMAGSFKHV